MRVSRDSTAIASRHISIPGMSEPSELREPAFAWRPVVAIAAALVLLLLAVAGRYGYHRDEDGAPIWLASEPRRSLPVMWSEMRSYG
jgi:hypothetical protein